LNIEFNIPVLYSAPSGLWHSVYCCPWVSPTVINIVPLCGTIELKTNASAVYLFLKKFVTLNKHP